MFENLLVDIMHCTHGSHSTLMLCNLDEWSQPFFFRTNYLIMEVAAQIDSCSDIDQANKCI